MATFRLTIDYVPEAIWNANLRSKDALGTRLEEAPEIPVGPSRA